MKPASHIPTSSKRLDHLHAQINFDTSTAAYFHEDIQKQAAHITRGPIEAIAGNQTYFLPRSQLGRTGVETEYRGAARGYGDGWVGGTGTFLSLSLSSPGLAIAFVWTGALGLQCFSTSAR